LWLRLWLWLWLELSLWVSLWFVTSFACTSTVHAYASWSLSPTNIPPPRLSLCPPGSGGEGLHAIHLFHSASRAPVRVVGDGCGDGGGQLKSPHGVRLASNGRTVVVADMANGRVAEFDVHTGAWVGDVTRSVRGMTDVEECAGGWLVVVSSSNLVAQVGNHQQVCMPCRCWAGVHALSLLCRCPCLVAVGQVCMPCRCCVGVHALSLLGRCACLVAVV
jgi:hypothetical protein